MQMSAFKFYYFSIYLLVSSIACFGQTSANFVHLTPMLNNDPIHISRVVQDSIGNMWMLNGGGIIVYDGYDYRLIKNNIIFPENNGATLRDIVTDKNKTVWCLSWQGDLSRYNTKKGNFENINIKNKNIIKIKAKENSLWLASGKGSIYKFENNKLDSITTFYYKEKPLRNIYDFSFSNPNELFISTNKGKVYNYSLKTNTTSELISRFSDYPSNIVLVTDNKERLWIGTEAFGLFVYDITSKTFVQDELFKGKKYNINKELFLELFCDSDGYIWGGTDGGGLYKIDSNSGAISLYIKHDSNEFSLSSNTITNISEDNHKNLWVSTNYGKLNILPSPNSNIKYHVGSADNSPQRAISVFKSSNKDLWVGTDGYGLTRISYNADGSTNESQYFNNVSLTRGFYVHALAEDSQSNIWFGTYKNGLYIHNTKNGAFKKLNIINSKNQEAVDVRALFKDSKGRMWVGSNISINVYDTNLNLLASFENDTKGLAGYVVESFIEDGSGNIWLGVYSGGTYMLNENLDDLTASTFTDYSYFEDNLKTNTRHNAKYMSLGTANEIWMISDNGRLLKFDTEKKAYTTFNHIEPLKGYNFSSAIAVDDDNLWLSSSNGIYHFDIKNEKVKIFYSTDGLQDNNFLSRSAFKDNSGILYFGGVKGVNYFNPKKLDKKETQPLLYINAIEILNLPASTLIPEQLDSELHNIELLKLKHNQSSFSFRFSAIDNILSSKYYYSYKLKGFDDNWISSRPERVATYTNIPPGKYVFQVRASTKRGEWNIPSKEINIHIAQPIWNKPIAHVLYLLLLGLLIYGIIKWYLLKKSLFLEKINHKKENELYESKMNFFAKMSHEIQTPITLILGPLDEMKNAAEQNGNLLLKQRINIIFNNAKRLSKIARELTLVRNKELDKLRLTVTKNNLLKHIENVSLSFKELARKKHIDFSTNCPENLSEAWYDKEKVEHIVYNLLSNAFKFTPKEGNIQLNVIPINSKKQIKLSVIDSGSGIPKEDLKDVFELFYRTKSSEKTKGNGIGLALVKDLVDLHKGEITVDSDPNEGTTFTIIIPIEENVYSDSEKITTSDTERPTIQEPLDLNKNKEKATNLSKKTILIVEDNYDLQTFLKELLKDEYNVLLAENGEEGYYYAKSSLPDLILSDIMMPKMDGIEMCEKLQSNKHTNYIPIILLTAKNSTNAKIAGLKSGAIEYVNKPFNTAELLLKIKNIISSREHIISKYRQEIISRPEVKIEHTQDEIFLKNLTTAINARMKDSNFKIESLADALNMSYSTVYRKCQTLTGHKLVDYVRLMRLKKAAVLITKYGYSVSEVAYMVGFNDPKYFSKCFKNVYKSTPKDFKSKAMSTENLEGFLKLNKIDVTTISS